MTSIILSFLFGAFVAQHTTIVKIDFNNATSQKLGNSINSFLQQIPHATKVGVVKSLDNTSKDNAWFMSVNQLNGAGASGEKNIFIFFEGDIVTCASYNSDGICTQESATEYCYRHANELFLVNDGLKSIVDAMCSGEDITSGSSSTFNPMKVFASQNPLWMNLKYEIFPPRNILDPFFATYAGKIPLSTNSRPNGRYEGSFQGSTYDKFKKSELTSVGLKWFFDWVNSGSNSAASQQCFDLQCKNKARTVTSRNCNHNVPRPFCSLNVISYSPAQCISVPNTPKQCGVGVPKYKIIKLLDKTLQASTLVRSQSEQALIDNLSDVLKANAADSRFNDPKYDAKRQIFQNLNLADFIADTTFCPCQCPAQLPEFNDPNFSASEISYRKSDTSEIANAYSQAKWSVDADKTAFIQNNLFQKVFTYCCKTGFKFEPKTGFNYNITNQGRCFTFTCRDDTNNYVNSVTGTWVKNSNNANDETINTAASWWTTRSFPNVGQKLDKIEGSCQPIVCPRNVPFPPIANIGNFKLFKASTTGVALETAIFNCQANYCGRIESDCEIFNSVGAWPASTNNLRRVRGTCQLQTCQNPSLLNGSNGGLLQTSIEQKLVYTCNQGFAIFLNGQLVPNNQVETQCQTDSLICEECNNCGNSLVPRPNIDFECRPIPCSEQVCNSIPNAEQVEPRKTSYEIGERITCKCVNGFEGVFATTCKKIGNVPRFDQISGTCKPLSCKLPAKIAHGTRLLDRLINPLNTPPIPFTRDQLEIRVGDSVVYQCDRNYELVFTISGQKADYAGCSRQCFVPKTDGTGWTVAKPTLDPLVCQCVPTRCERLIPSQGYTFADPQETGAGYKVPDRPIINLKCSNTNQLSPVTCENNGKWSKPRSCFRTGCIDPRTQNYTNCQDTFEHTYTSLDTFRKPGASNWTTVNRNTVQWPNRFIESNDGRLTLGGDFSDGDEMRFTCKKGYRPFLRVPQAVQSNQWGPLQGNTIKAVCKNGVWQSDALCRCDGWKSMCCGKKQDLLQLP